MENWKTKTIVMEGGTRLNIPPVARDQLAPGSLIDSQNFESGHEGGYARIKGYNYYDTAVVPGTSRILGCFVFNDGVLACRDAAIYFSTGAGWSADLAPSPRTDAEQYRAAKYRWTGGTYITLVDSVNLPVRYDGSTFVELADAPSGATCVKDFKNHLFLGKDGVLTFSAPDDDTDYDTANGAGAFPVGDEIVNLAAWRGSLFIFCRNSIHVLTGDDLSTFAVAPVTTDLGCEFPDTVIEVNGDIMFCAPDGIRLISRVISSGEVSVDTLSNAVQGYIQENIRLYRTSGSITATACDEKTQYRLFFTSEDDDDFTAPGLFACLASGTQGNSWEFFKSKGFHVACTDHGRINDGSTELIVHGCYNGYIWQQEYANSLAGTDIEAFIQLPFLIFDDPAIRKILYKLRLYVNVEDDALAELTVQVLLDDDDATVLQPSPIDLTTFIPALIAIYGFTGGASGTTYGTSVYGQGASSNYRTQLVGGGYNASLLISSDDQNPAYAIKTAIIEYVLGARQ